MKEKAVVTVVGKDTVGILAKASTCCANANANVVEVTQSVMAEFFTMIMMIEIDQINCSISELKDSIKEALPNMEVHVMHEKIFDSMHRI